MIHNVQCFQSDSLFLFFFFGRKTDGVYLTAKMQLTNNPAQTEIVRLLFEDKHAATAAICGQFSDIYFNKKFEVKPPAQCSLKRSALVFYVK